MSNPVLTGLFGAGDYERVAAIQAELSADRLARLRQTPGGLYDARSWRELGRLGLFGLALPEDGDLTPRATGQAIAMMADCLINDTASELDLAIYVHGLVAVHTLHFHRDRDVARRVIGPAVAGEQVFCTAYTDADPAKPAFGRRQTGGYWVRGRKWLSVNMPHAETALVTFQTESQTAVALVPLEDSGLTRTEHHQHGSDRIYSQGALSLNEVFVPDGRVLSSGLKRLRVWNRVMTASRLLNAASAHRSLSRLFHHVVETLHDRPVCGRPLCLQPEFIRFVADTQTTLAVLEAALVSVIAELGYGRIEEAGVAGLKAVAVRDSLHLASRALTLAGGAGTLADNEIARLVTSLSHHRFSSGGEAQLMALYETSIGRRSAPAADGLAA